MTALPPFALALLLTTGAAAHADGTELAKLAWLGGCWQSEGGEPGSVEQWLPLAGGSLLGVSRTVKEGKTVAYEFMDIRAQADGTLAFHAHPSGRPADTFPALRLTDTEVVFENLQHDFPQRVVYAVEGGNKLNARIEGLRNGSLRVIHYPMRRVSCDAMLAGG
jgi:hypothetical protein